MAYSPAAEALRRCQAITRATGEQCRAWAIWGHPDQLCSTHAGRTRYSWERYSERVKAQCEALRFPASISDAQLMRWLGGNVQHAAYPPCRCSAYPWPHRPGGGACQWPDVPGMSVADHHDPPDFREPDRYPPGVLPAGRF